MVRFPHLHAVLPPRRLAVPPGPRSAPLREPGDRLHLHRGAGGLTVAGGINGHGGFSVSRSSRVYDASLTVSRSARCARAAGTLRRRGSTRMATWRPIFLAVALPWILCCSFSGDLPFTAIARRGAARQPRHTVRRAVSTVSSRLLCVGGRGLVGVRVQLRRPPHWQLSMRWSPPGHRPCRPRASSRGRHPARCITRYEQQADPRFASCAPARCRPAMLGPGQLLRIARGEGQLVKRPGRSQIQVATGPVSDGERRRTAPPPSTRGPPTRLPRGPWPPTAPGAGVSRGGGCGEVGHFGGAPLEWRRGCAGDACRPVGPSFPASGDSATAHDPAAALGRGRLLPLGSSRVNPTTGKPCRGGRRMA